MAIGNGLPSLADAHNRVFGVCRRGRKLNSAWPVAA
jgi:hypothetical protein